MIRFLIITILILNSIILHSQIRSGISTFHFNPHFYLGANAGVNAFLADGYSEYGFKNCYGFSQYYNIGYNLSELIGVSVNLSNSKHNWPGTTVNSFKNYEFKVQKIGFDFMFNISNYIDVYDLSRISDFSVGIGSGYLFRDKSSFQKEYNGAFFKTIAQYDFRITNIFDISLKGILNFASEKFNEKEFGRKVDLMPELMVGITYQNRKSYSKRWSR